MTIKAIAPAERAFVPGYIHGPDGIVRFATAEEKALLKDIDRLKLIVLVVCVAALLMAGAYIGTLAGVLLS